MITREEINAVLYDKELMQMLSARLLPPARPDGFGVTAPEFAKANDINVHYARGVLTEAVQSGLLVKTTMRVKGGGKVQVYHKAGETWAE